MGRVSHVKKILRFGPRPPGAPRVLTNRWHTPSTRSRARKEVDMWTVATRVTLLTAGFLVCAGRAARAGAVAGEVPFPFVVHGRTLPAGQYRVEYDPAESSVLVIRGEHGTKADTMTL